MKPHLAVLAVFLASAASAQPSAVLEPPSAPPVLANDTCAGCFAYLVFSPSMEPESDAIRGGNEPPASSRAADEVSDRSREHAELQRSPKQ